MISYLAADGEYLVGCPCCPGRVIERPEHFVIGSEDYRALLIRVSTDNDHFLETFLSRELVNPFSFLTGDVNADLLHDLDHRREDLLLRIGARAENLKNVPGVLPQKCLAHLAPGGVACAEK